MQKKCPKHMQLDMQLKKCSNRVFELITLALEEPNIIIKVYKNLK